VLPVHPFRIAAKRQREVMFFVVFNLTTVY